MVLDVARSRIGVNYKQLPVNCPLNPVGKYSWSLSAGVASNSLLATFTRDGAMSFDNQGSRPVFASTQDALKLIPRPYNDDNHTIWTGGAVKYVSVPSEIDFDQPRIFVRTLSSAGSQCY